MLSTSDRQRFRNEELLLKVSRNVRRDRWDEDRYGQFLDALCGTREYQKEALREALRYLLSGEYDSLRALARENFEANDVLRQRYGSWTVMERQLQLPNQLAASLDLATGTGKSYVLYGLSLIMLAEGVVDSILVLCPSTTIEDGLLKKFRELAANADLRDLLPEDAKVRVPHIINASESIVPGSICVENYHAILEHVGSSVRDSLWGKGARVLLLNDEAHHVANESGKAAGKWKEFITDPAYNFRYIIGATGTAYVENEYFADVISRYSLRQAMEDNVVKSIEYVVDMPKTKEDTEKWQIIRNRHEETKRRLQNTILPLTIIVTNKITTCKNVAEDLKTFLRDFEGISAEEADERVLTVYSGAPDTLRLGRVDLPSNKAEWIVSVSMLTEGWDVKRVFGIVPHEKRAFDSKLLIAQVLGRGLRRPDGWSGAPPVVTVFNHSSWAGSIQSLVDEVLEREKRLTTRVLPDSPLHFDLHQVDYTVETISVAKAPTEGPYKMLEKGYVELAAEVAKLQMPVTFEDARTRRQNTWQANIVRSTFKPREVAERMFERLEQNYDPDDPDPNLHHDYTKDLPLDKLEESSTNHCSLWL